MHSSRTGTEGTPGHWTPAPSGEGAEGAWGDRDREHTAGDSICSSTTSPGYTCRHGPPRLDRATPCQQVARLGRTKRVAEAQGSGSGKSPGPTLSAGSCLVAQTTRRRHLRPGRIASRPPGTRIPPPRRRHVSFQATPARLHPPARRAGKGRATGRGGAWRRTLTPTTRECWSRWARRMRRSPA